MKSNRPLNSLHGRQPARKYQTGVNQSPSVNGKLADFASAIQCTAYCIGHVHEITILTWLTWLRLAKWTWRAGLSHNIRPVLQDPAKNKSPCGLQATEYSAFILFSALQDLLHCAGLMGAVLRQLHVCRFLLDVDPTRKSEPWAKMETGIFQGVQGSRSRINNTSLLHS
jgi:hypothetical protein